MKITVNGEVFGNDICMFQMQRISQEKPGISEKDAKEEIAENLVKHAMMKQASKESIGAIPTNQIDAELNRLKKNYPSEAEFQKMCQANHTTEDMIKADLEDSIRINIFIRDITKNVPPPPSHILKKYYERERTVSMKPKEIHAAHIVMKPDPSNPSIVYDKMLRIRKQLLDGAEFAAVADKHSSCNDEGGDMGYFTRGQMVEEFDVIAFSMEKDEISPIFQTHFGYHIVKVYDMKEPVRLTFEECKDNIKAEITDKMTTECINKWCEEEKPKADIKIED